MSEASIPAWKRAGLKHSKTAAGQSKSTYDPLKEGLKRAGDDGEKPTKPAKKPKLAKADRPAPTHELDQLAYLRQYSEDRENWKFSKQKQNWILKHAFSENINEKYETPLIHYTKGLQGSARNWVLEESLDVIKRWNEFMRADLDKREEAPIQPENDKEEENKEREQEPESPAKDEKKSKKKQPKAKTPPASKVPSQAMVLRAQKLIEALGEECPEVELLDQQKTTES